MSKTINCNSPLEWRTNNLYSRWEKLAPGDIYCLLPDFFVIILFISENPFVEKLHPKMDYFMRDLVLDNLHPVAYPTSSVHALTRFYFLLEESQDCFS